MKGFLEWFKSSTRMKRWFFLVLIGIILCCFGFSKVLVQKELNFTELALIIVSFTFGFTFVILGVIYIQKRTLELLVQANSKVVGNEKEVKMKSLIFNKNVYEEGPKVVIIGGGTGLNTVLQGIKKYTNNVTAIVTVSDYGKGLTDSRRELNLLPLEDIKESMIALAENQTEMQNIMDHNFISNKLRGLSFGDIFMLAMEEIHGNMAESVEKSSSVLKITGKVLPVTMDEIKICAELKDGTVVEEKDKISQAVYDKITKINRIYISPSNCVPAPGVLDAIKDADAIVIGPGSFYTNIIPNLLVKNVAKTIKESKAIKVYVSNIMTEPGQTDNYSVSDHIDALIEHVGKGIADYCICDTGDITPELIRKYNKVGSDLVEQDFQKASGKGMTIIQKDMAMVKDGVIRHHPDVIASTVIELVCDELKYKDKQNDTQYVLINSRLKKEKEKEKKYVDNKKKEKKVAVKKERKNDSNKPKLKSKFSEKYKDRIKSIQETDMKIEENKKLFEASQMKVSKRGRKKVNK